MCSRYQPPRPHPLPLPLPLPLTGCVRRDPQGNIVLPVPLDSPAALSAAFAEAINARDVDGALDLWIEDAAILRPDGQTVRGRGAIGAALHALVDNGASVEVDVAELYSAGDVALAVGTLTINGSDGDGNSYSQRSQSVVIYTRDADADADGVWRLAIDAPWGLPSV